mmetsp:Transcript_27657/g.66639  ORF Transcript_27657/g.66639 Transcript_27657/m.66639 type:complete len:248 (+) Transcript_27657:921-1664(+)
MLGRAAILVVSMTRRRVDPRTSPSPSPLDNSVATYCGVVIITRHHDAIAHPVDAAVHFGSATTGHLEQSRRQSRPVVRAVLDDVPRRKLCAHLEGGRSSIEVVVVVVPPPRAAVDAAAAEGFDANEAGAAAVIAPSGTGAGVAAAARAPVVVALDRRPTEAAVVRWMRPPPRMGAQVHGIVLGSRGADVDNDGFGPRGGRRGIEREVRSLLVVVVVVAVLAQYLLLEREARVHVRDPRIGPWRAGNR